LLVHLLEAVEQTVMVSPLDEAFELLDSCWSANEELNAARVARNVGLFLLCDPDL